MSETPNQPPPARSELVTRLILGSSMLALIGGVFWLDASYTTGVLTAALLGLVALGGVYEYVAMLRGAGRPIASGLLLLTTLLLCASALAVSGGSHADRALYPLVVGTFVLLFASGVRSLAPGRLEQGLDGQGAALLGFVWIAWPMFLAQQLALWHLPSVLYVLLICKVGDIGAYFTGKAIGRHKLILHVSKGKTYEGAVGSVIASCAVAVGFRGLLTPPEADLGLTAAVAIGIILNVGAQLGDLLESVLKRTCGVKDSSGLLPAHGGVLDLIDSLLLTYPAYFLILVSLT